MAQAPRGALAPPTPAEPRRRSVLHMLLIVSTRGVQRGFGWGAPCSADRTGRQVAAAARLWGGGAGRGAAPRSAGVRCGVVGGAALQGRGCIRPAGWVRGTLRFGLRCASLVGEQDNELGSATVNWGPRYPREEPAPRKDVNRFGEAGRLGVGTALLRSKIPPLEACSFVLSPDLSSGLGRSCALEPVFLRCWDTWCALLGRGS